MSDKKVRASARVTLTVEISVGDVWGSDCSVDQIHKQAREGALHSLSAALARAANPKAESDVVRRVDLRVIGEPRVTAVLVEEDR